MYMNHNSSKGIQSNNGTSIRNLTSSFNIIKVVGEGTYGKVYKAIDTSTNEIVAVKSIKVTGDPNLVHFLVNREIEVLKHLSSSKIHKNIVHMKEDLFDPAYAARSRCGSTFYEEVISPHHFVFEYCETDLAKLIKYAYSPNGKAFTSIDIKYIMKMILEGLLHAHDCGIIHRDLKSANVLINNRGVVKIADWGLAKFYNPTQPNSLSVASIGYRAPEIIKGNALYTYAIDMWSVGCIFSELVTGKQIFTPKRREVDEAVDQLKLIHQICDSPSNFEQRFPMLDREGISLLKKMLTLNPEERISALDANIDPYLVGNPTTQPDYDNHKLNLPPSVCDTPSQREICCPKPFPEKIPPLASYHRYQQPIKPNTPNQHHYCPVSSAPIDVKPSQVFLVAPVPTSQPSKPHIIHQHLPRSIPPPPPLLAYATSMSISGSNQLATLIPLAPSSPPPSKTPLPSLTLKRQRSNDTGIESINKQHKSHHHTQQQHEHSKQISFPFSQYVPNLNVNGQMYLQ